MGSWAIESIRIKRLVVVMMITKDQRIVVLVEWHWAKVGRLRRSLVEQTTR